ncbi:hypothetical protein [Nonomuraea gerenzanensis]|uniref:Uncharacterized protein n=1 Tax=Nonomuraea gerenzanensis TaxID=93944 RepID=A0A1M4EDR0_9ACTN|nr:hypothetical protein [Nonomuraea gerenzanensis]UBU08372.1 hypothetical protein LCN96_28670 [Nonomuraea gerenzanensis]SBO96713.1 hypothetical protein BN4615_P6229 [Nonomuraea gerenzanensis]
MRRLAGHAAALSMSLYLAVKLIWVTAALLGHGPDNYGTADWVLLNVVTVVLATTGIALGLALAQRWGRRLPAMPVIFFSWVGAGFLVPMLPYSVIKGVLGALGVDLGGGADSASAPRGETVLLTIGFAGMAVGLAVALPIYLRERWPRAFLGRVGDGPARSSTLVTMAMAVACGLGLAWSSWALGGTLGLDPAHHDHWDLNGRLLNASSGLWALLGAWSIWALTRCRPARLRRWIPMTLAFGASGSLFAWSSWKLPLVILRPGGFVTAEYTMVAVLQHALGITVGLIFMTAVLRVARRQDTAPARSTTGLG